LEINNRLPKGYLFLDTEIRRRIGESLRRGSLDVYYNLSGAVGDTVLTLDDALCEQYASAARTLLDRYDELEDDFGVTAMLRMPGVLVETARETDDEQKRALVMQALDSALKQLVAVREGEGATLHQDLSRGINAIRASLNKINARAPEIISEYKARLWNKVQTVLEDVPLDEGKLLNEVAFYVDKVDTNEEIKRLYAHLDAFTECLERDGEIGRKLEFLTQEMTRETNTLGVKCADIVTTELVLSIKNEIERLKEQSRNVE
jgi:uncharacterized protein (TIGR00255 family)